MPRSGLTYRPLLEQVMVAHWAHYRYWHEWLELDGDQQALLVAAYRSEKSMEAVVHHETGKAQRRRSRHKGVGRKGVAGSS